MHEQAQLKLNVFTSIQIADYSRVDHDPYWDEIVKQAIVVDEYTPDASSCTSCVVQEHKTAPEHAHHVREQFIQEESDRWNPADFGEVSRKVEPGGQLTIFYDDSDEPPDPDDYQSIEDYHQAWAAWKISCPRTPIQKDANVESGNFNGVVEIPIFAPEQTDTAREKVSSDTSKFFVREQVTHDTLRPAPEHNTPHWVEKYWVQRREEKYWYYRYCWMVGRKINRVHIGSVRSLLAQQKKETVEIAINDGRSPLEIKQMLAAN